MRKAGMMALLLAAGVSVSGCTTTDRYGYNDPYRSNGNTTLGRAAAGAAVGAAAGAGLGAVVGGVGVGEGAAIGAVAGGVLGAATANNNGRTYGGEVRWYRDDYGRCYYLDRDGIRRYDASVRC